MSGNYKQLDTNYFKKNEIPLSEYPRPQYRRDSYYNLNGYWDFCFAKNDQEINFNRQILVPFSPETLLSEINKKPLEGDFLYYRKKVILDQDFFKDLLILHFGGIDQEVEIYINQKLVLIHQIPLLPFSVDITDYIDGFEFEILLKIKDLCEKGEHIIGKQKTKRGGIWYTPQSGVLQTIWLESVHLNYLLNVKIMPNVDEEKVTFVFNKKGVGNVTTKVFFNNELINSIISNQDEVVLHLPNAHRWSPSNPNLYQVTYEFNNDFVSSYFAFRKVERKIHENGFAYVYLNNEPIFVNGVLDQGYFSDGLLTAPSDQAYIDDMSLLKKMGFNMLRKHIKLEPYRFYYHCDVLGILVMQDMINLLPPKHFNFNALKAMFFNVHQSDIKTSLFGVQTKAQEENYLKALKQTLNLYDCFPSIITWIPFNEGWGQFSAVEITKLISALDKTRLIDHASGWSDQGAGDFYSRHIYFAKLHLNVKKDEKRIIAISEFGGYSYKIKNHSFNLLKTFGYRIFKNQVALENRLRKLYLNEALPLIKKGLGVLVYTQLSDVEDEVNGLITFDRKVVKIKTTLMATLNKQIEESFSSFLK